jgi:hypothetical protein
VRDWSLGAARRSATYRITPAGENVDARSCHQPARIGIVVRCAGVSHWAPAFQRQTPSLELGQEHPAMTPGAPLVRFGVERLSESYRVITLEFVVPTVLAIALAIMLSVGAVFLTDIYLGPIDQAQANYPLTDSH